MSTVRHRWQVQAGYVAAGTRVVRPVAPPAIPGGVWTMLGDGRAGVDVAVGVRVRARSADVALALVEQRVRAGWPPGSAPVRVSAEVRPARAWGRRRRPVVLFGGLPGDGPGDGPTGVREPRRPLPVAPAGRIALALPGPRASTG